MPTITINPYKGWSVQKLQQRCRQLVRANMRLGMLIAVMVPHLKGGIDALPTECRDEVRRIYDSRNDDVDLDANP